MPGARRLEYMMKKDLISSPPRRSEDKHPAAAGVMENLMADLAHQTPALLQRMQMNLPLPRPTLKLIRTLTRLTDREGVPPAACQDGP